MRTIKGPAVFLAQFASDEAPFNSLKGLSGWAADKGFKGVQIPTWDTRVIDLEKAAESQDYVDEFKGILAEDGLVVTELASHLQGQLVALHPSFDLPADSFAPASVRGNPKARQQWAVNQLVCAAIRTRTPPGHPEGYIESFTNLYSGFAAAIRAKADAGSAGTAWDGVPTSYDGLKGVAFVDAVVGSHERFGGGWQKPQFA